MTISRSTKIVISIVGCIVLLICGGALIIRNQPKQISTTRSAAPQFDIVSGDISSSTAQTILSQVEQMTGTRMDFNDLVIRKDTYHKTFSTDQNQYPTVTMLLDTKNPISTYQVTVSSTATYQNSVLVVCAPTAEQISTTKTCVAPMENSL